MDFPSQAIPLIRPLNSVRHQPKGTFPREGGDPSFRPRRSRETWAPAFAGERPSNLKLRIIKRPDQYETDVH